MMLTIPQEHNDKMEALGYRPVGAKWYHPVRKAIQMNGSFTVYDYSAAKDAWMVDEELSVQRFPWEVHISDGDGTALGVFLVNGWYLELDLVPVDFGFTTLDNE